MADYKKGKVVKGIVTGIEDYGAFMSFDEYYTGLIHISEISRGFVKDITDFVNVGDYIYAQILDVDDEEYHLKLSIKDIKYKVDGGFKRKKIKETSSGFNTLANNLPKWIHEKLKSMKNPIDK